MQVVNITAKSTMLLFVINFILKMVLNGILQYMVLFLSALQMIVHLQMLQIVVPANVSGFFQTLNQILQFDVIEQE